MYKNGFGLNNLQCMMCPKKENNPNQTNLQMKWDIAKKPKK